MPLAPTPTDGFRHEAMFHAGDDEFLAGTLPFVRAGLAGDEPVLVVVGPERIRRLRAALGDEAGRVRFADMDTVGANPARIIPAWEEFVTEHAGRRIRGIGEPIVHSRSAHELVECHRHESLLNVAFGETPGFALMCPYDTGALHTAVLEEARRTHPRLRRAGGRSSASDAFAGAEAARAPFAAPLPEPEGETFDLAFDLSGLGRLRRVVSDLAVAAGLGRRQAGDLLLAVSELAANSVRHGGGRGVLRVWTDDTTLLCEISDRGRILDPLAGRQRPVSGQIGGYGLWLANQVCDLVQVRTFATGGVVRLHMRAR